MTSHLSSFLPGDLEAFGSLMTDLHLAILSSFADSHQRVLRRLIYDVGDELTGSIACSPQTIWAHLTVPSVLYMRYPKDICWWYDGWIICGYLGDHRVFIYCFVRGANYAEVENIPGNQIMDINCSWVWNRRIIQRFSLRSAWKKSSPLNSKFSSNIYKKPL